MEDDSDFNLLYLDSVESIMKMHNLDKESFEYKFLYVHLLGNINKMCEVIQD